MMKALRIIWKCLGFVASATERIIIVGILVVGASYYVLANNYSATQGTGTVFASIVIGGTNYLANLICDATAGETQCAKVDSAGNLYVVSSAGVITPISGNITTLTGSITSVANSNPNGGATAANSSPVTPSNQPVGSASYTPAQVTVTTGATLIAAARTGVTGTGRISITVTNTTTTPIYTGGSGVTTTNGDLLP